MGKIQIQENAICFERKDEVVRIEPYGPNCLRFRSSRNRVLSEESWTLLPAREAAQVTISDEGQGAVLKNGLIQVEVGTGKELIILCGVPSRLIKLII